MGVANSHRVHNVPAPAVEELELRKPLVTDFGCKQESRKSGLEVQTPGFATPTTTEMIMLLWIGLAKPLSAELNKVQGEKRLR
jgi:hypothetical protein